MGKFIDFNSIIKTDWTKPSVQKNPLWIIAALGAVLALVSVFVKWLTLKTTLTINGETNVTNLSTSALDNTEGIFVLVALVLVVYGLLYRQWGVATLAGVIVFAFGCSYMVSAMAETATMVSKGETYTLAELSKDLKNGVEYYRSMGCEVTHFTEVGGYGFMYAVIGGLLTTVCSFLLYKKNK